MFSAHALSVLLLFALHVFATQVASNGQTSSNLESDLISHRSKSRFRRTIEVNSQQSGIINEQGGSSFASRRNATCIHRRSYPCRRQFRVPYVDQQCRINRRATPAPCTRFRYELRQTNCLDIKLDCCEGYTLEASGYCELKNSKSGCRGTQLLTSSSGTITSPGYPQNYVVGLYCDWVIQGGRGSKVIMTFLDLDMEEPRIPCNLSAGDCSGNCNFDWITIRDASTTKTVCGRFTPTKHYVSNTNYFNISITSDESTVGRGFKLVYSIVPETAVNDPGTCGNGREWTLCHRTCALTCYEQMELDKQYGSWNICIKSDNNNSLVNTKDLKEMFTCVPGCTCPRGNPVWDFRRCLKIDQCSNSRFKCGVQLKKSTKKIIGGSTADDGSWPWMVQITTNAQYPDCGATLICSDWLVTAAHCFLDRRTRRMPSQVDINEYWFHLGKYWKYSQLDKRRIESYRAKRIFVHPDYDQTRDLNDIAVVQLDGHVGDIDRIKPICLPKALDPTLLTEAQMNRTSEHPNFGDKCVTIGWGSTRNVGPEPDKLKELQMPIKPAVKCTYRYFHWRSTICAGGIVNQDTCKGDSGGPFMCKRGGRWFLDGVTSFGDDCATTTPGGYSRVGHFMPWIRGIIGNDCGKP